MEAEKITLGGKAVKRITLGDAVLWEESPHIAIYYGDSVKDIYYSDMSTALSSCNVTRVKAIFPVSLQRTIRLNGELPGIQHSLATYAYSLPTPPVTKNSTSFPANYLELTPYIYTNDYEYLICDGVKSVVVQFGLSGAEVFTEGHCLLIRDYLLNQVSVSNKSSFHCYHGRVDNSLFYLDYEEAMRQLGTINRVRVVANIASPMDINIPASAMPTGFDVSLQTIQNVRLFTSSSSNLFPTGAIYDSDWRNRQNLYYTTTPNAVGITIHLRKDGNAHISHEEAEMLYQFLKQNISLR